MTAATAGLAGQGVGGVRDTARDDIGRILLGSGPGGLNAVSDVAACLMPLLTAIGWGGDPRGLAEALPHFTDTLDIEDLRTVLANLNYATYPMALRLRDIDPRLLPCLFLPEKGSALVLLKRKDDSITVFNGELSNVTKIDARGQRGTAYFVSAIEEDDESARSASQKDWVHGVARRFRGLVLQVFAITLVTSLLAVTVPLFIMSVYDRVVTTRSEEMLLYLCAGVGMALGIEMMLRLVRARILSHVGARLDTILGTAVFRHVLHLPLIMTERATIGAQLSRLKQFEAVRDFFTGPLAGVFLELPFVAVFIGIIAMIAGPLAWIPVILIALFALLGLLVMPSMRRAVTESGEARAQRQAFLIELLSNFRAVKTSAAEAIWSDRYRRLSARTALANFRTTQISVLIQTLAQTLMLTAGIATIGLGTLLVLDGVMTVGALVACMALIWRVLSPLQTGFLSLSRLEQVKLALRQINQLMTLRLERDPGQAVETLRRLRGAIAFQRVSLRYSPNGEPALLGVDLEIAPGEIVAVTGPSSAGKSTLLKLIAGLYQAQAGAVLIDGMDIRQLDMGELRGAIAFAPKSSELFHGTIAQNLRLANPTASDAMLSQAILDAGLLDEVLALPEGMETRLNDQLQRQLPIGFKQGLNLARAYVQQAAIYLLDEPAANLDDEGDAALRRKLQQLRGKATVVLTTYRPSHMRLADRVVYMQDGRVLAAGAPDQILPKLKMA